MVDPDRVTPLIERIVADARIVDRRERDDLRRELRAHFEDARASCGSDDEAIARFGSAYAVSSDFRRVYRARYLSAYVAKVAAGLAASLAAALLIEFLLSRPGALRYIAPTGSLVVLAFGILRESVGRLIRRPRIATAVAGWLAGFAALALWEYAVHNMRGVPFTVFRAALSGAILVAVAGSTAFIMRRADRAFARLLETA